MRCIGWMEKNDTTASPKIGILHTNSGIFCDLRNFDFVFWKLRNPFLLARGPCQVCQQNFDLKFDFDVSTESGILQIQKRWIWWRNLDFVQKLALVWKGSKWRKTISWQALPFREMLCVVRCVYSPVHRRLYVDRIEGIMLVSIWYCIVYTKNGDRF